MTLARPRKLLIAAALCGLFSVGRFAHAQTPSSPGAERVFPQSRAVIEKALKNLQSNLSGRLPVLDGFADAGDHPLDRYQRGFYQATVDVTANPAGGSLVRVHTKVTAWYSDPVASKSGYQLLTSNGRLEADLLDQLADQLGKSVPTVAATGSAKSAPPASSPTDTKASPFKFPTKSPSIADQERASRDSASAKTPSDADKAHQALEAEVRNLEEILKTQAHPTNLIAVKKSGTPVVETPSLSAKPMFLASQHDEFELLDFNADWVHVRISGLSRGWVWRNSVEMPEGISDAPGSASPAQTPAADLFHVSREETASFPGDWEPLRGKSVKIISVQKLDDAAKDASSRDRLEYSKFLFEKNIPELGKKAQELAGIVLVFDSADGGMVAATAATLQQWQAGKLSDSAFWHKCFFDPPETFDAGSSSP